MSRPAVQQFAGHYTLNLGWTVLPLRARTKQPYTEDWNGPLVHSPDDFHADDNIGIRSVDGIVVSDPDCDEAVLLADAFLPATGAVYGRGDNLRRKRVYNCPKLTKPLVFKDDETGKTILELRVNHQDMAPPSIHPNGERLKWCGSLLPSARVEVDVLVRMHQLLATATLAARYYPAQGARHDWTLALSGALRRLGLSDVEAVKVIEQAGRYASEAKPDDRLREIRTTYARGDDQPLTSFRELKDLAGKHFVATLKKIWNASGKDHRGFITDHDGKILTNKPQNIRVALDLLNVRLLFDAFANKPLVERDGKRVFLGDAIRNRLWVDIDERFGFLPPQALFDIVLQDTAHRNPFHPVRDYLSALDWDGTPRVETWLVDYGRASDSEYVRAVGRLVLVAAVRRVMQPGCKFDELLVLESPQGLLKSSTLRALCQDQNWFSDDLPLNVDAKQIIERTGGKWIIEASDLAGKNKSSIEQLKATLSRQIDGPVRLAYAHLTDEVPRQFVIIGTTNSHKYLKDSTGNRRFWPVRVQEFDVEAIRRDRDQLWAEAVRREASGESIRLDPRLYALAEVQQERRRVEDAWEEPLSKLFEEGKAYRVTTEELWTALGIPVERRTQADGARIVAIMESLGFEHKKARALGNTDGKTVKRWCRDGHQPGLENDDDDARD